MNQINKKTTFGLVILPLLIFPLCLSAQVKQNKFLQHSSIETLRQATRVADLREKSKRDSSSYMLERAAAIRFANEYGYPVSGNFEGRDYALQGFDDFGFLRYYQTTNAISAQVIGTDQLYPSGDAGLSLTGSGRVLGVWEVSRPRATHNELNGRLTQMDNSTQSIGNHATHVCGTMIAAGVNPNARGMAYQANLAAHDSNNDLSEMANAATQGLRLSNHSYGIPTGWEYGDYSGSTGWHWFGNTSISSSTDYKFGLYDSDTRDLDNLVFNAPLYLPVRSVGNDRNDSGPNPGGQHWVRNSSGQWVSSTATRQPDGGAEGYDCITTEANAKNILTVGAVEVSVSGGFQTTSIADFSSYGPTDDGRIKPDIVARGVDVFSSIGSSNSSYGLSDGTSMATPSVTGSLELLLQHYENLHPGFTLRNSALKALVLHTADQIGINAPNYRTGWGIMNTRAAADLISSDAEGEGDAIYSSVTIENNEIFPFFFYHDGSGHVVATLAWMDPAGPISTNTLNPSALRLVNDLDMRLISESDNTVYEPWRLDPAAPASAATKGDNFRDNVEQIRENLPAGFYVLLVGHKGTLSGGSQAFSLILSGLPKNLLQPVAEIPHDYL
ncbi:MAG: S8 family serine peptidase [Lewinellaceae bacterium]|nr:S8 family serine peptidase [Lewinellaceae bacterium]